MLGQTAQHLPACLPTCVHLPLGAYHWAPKAGTLPWLCECECKVWASVIEIPRMGKNPWCRERP